jgi:hypothetical protein
LRAEIEYDSGSLVLNSETFQTTTVVFAATA